jgi:hypothetical protein
MTCGVFCFPARKPTIKIISRIFGRLPRPSRFVHDSGLLLGSSVARLRIRLALDFPLLFLDENKRAPT